MASCRPSCIHPQICPNLNGDHRPLLDIYRAVDSMPGIKHSYIGSGVRYDMLLHNWNDEALNLAAREYTKELITRHVSGRLKVAPEHTEDHVLYIMRKPSFTLFHKFKSIFDKVNREAGLRQQIIPYFISSHPGCTMQDMENLAHETRSMGLETDQVQDFTPTPMTMSTEMYYTGINPETGEKIFCARNMREKEEQRLFFFWYKSEEQKRIKMILKKIGRQDLLKKLGIR